MVDAENQVKHWKQKVKKAEKEYGLQMKVQGQQEQALDFLDNRQHYDVQLQELLMKVKKERSEVRELELVYNKNKSLE